MGAPQRVQCQGPIAMPSRHLPCPPTRGAGPPVSRRSALAFLAGALALPARGAGAQEMRFFRIATGSSGASYFPIGGLIASAISNPPGSRDCEAGGSCGVPGLIAVAQTTQGSVENINLVASSGFDSGLAQADIAFWAYTGTSVFEKTGPITSIAAIANLYQESLHIVVPADSRIESVEDLRGKRVAVGEEASGTAATARLVLDAYGLSARRVKLEPLAVAPASEKLKAGALDAIFVVSGHPVPALADLAEHMAVRLLPLVGEKAETLRTRHPFLAVDLIPAGAYRGVASTVTVGIGALWIVRADLDADLVYGITRALWHPANRKLLDSSPIGRSIQLETALSGIPIPLHPGAERYYEEALRAPRPVTSQ